MDLIDRLTELSNRAAKVLDQLETEEATKNALIMPFINALGYDVFNPLEVVPELVADVGTKKGEKVDYAIMRDGKPIILFECKAVGADLEKLTPSQLYRYFSVTDARFGVFTNGVHYQFFSDLEQPNKMDSRPFLEFRMTRVSEELAAELKKFAKESFDLENILSTASELKYSKGIKRLLEEEWGNPSEDFVKLFSGRVYSGRFTQTVKDQFTQITKRAFHEFVSDHVNRRLKNALDVAPDEEGASEVTQKSPEDAATGKDSVLTTEDELEGFYIVKSIVRSAVDPNRVFMRDTQSYCGVLLDDNNRKPICRLLFNSSQKYLGLLDEQKNVTRHALVSVASMASLAG